MYAEGGTSDLILIGVVVMGASGVLRVKAMVPRFVVTVPRFVAGGPRGPSSWSSSEDMLESESELAEFDI